MDLKWKRQPQERSGTYRFNGKFYASRGVVDLLSRDEIMAIYYDVLSLVKQEDGIDYLVVYQHEETSQKLYFIDQLNDYMKADLESNFPKDANHCTLILAEEY